MVFVYLECYLVYMFLKLELVVWLHCQEHLPCHWSPLLWKGRPELTLRQLLGLKRQWLKVRFLYLDISWIWASVCLNVLLSVRETGKLTLISLDYRWLGIQNVVGSNIKLFHYGLEQLLYNRRNMYKSEQQLFITRSLLIRYIKICICYKNRTIIWFLLHEIRILIALCMRAVWSNHNIFLLKWFLITHPLTWCFFERRGR